MENIVYNLVFTLSNNKEFYVKVAKVLNIYQCEIYLNNDRHTLGDWFNIEIDEVNDETTLIEIIEKNIECYKDFDMYWGVYKEYNNWIESFLTKEDAEQFITQNCPKNEEWCISKTFEVWM